MRYCLLLVAVVSSGCSELEPPNLIAEFGATLEDGTCLPDQLTGSPGTGLTIAIRFVATNERESLSDRPIKSPEEWRIVGVLTDSDGEIVPVESTEFYDYDHLAWIGDGALGIDLETVWWRSPDPPESMDENAEYRWGRVELPEQKGLYRLAIIAHPTADPEVIGIDSEWGDGVTLFSTKVEVSGTMSPQPSGCSFTLQQVDKQTRSFFVAQLEEAGAQ